MKVGFIGLGTMGASMAANLQKAGYELVVHDIRRAAAERHLAAGAVWADSPKALAEQCEVIFTSLPGPPEVEEVALGAERAPRRHEGRQRLFRPLDQLADPGARAQPALFRKARLHARRAGQRRAARAPRPGKLALWVGGDEQIFNRHKKVLDAIGDQARYIGPIGAGSVAKLVHNCAGYAIQTCLAEVFTMGVKAGVEPLALWEAVRQGAGGRRRTFDALVDQFLPDSYDPPAFALRLAHKDVTLATELGARAQGADAHGQSGARRIDRGAEPRLGRPRLARRDAAAEGARRRHDQGRSRRGQSGARTRRRKLSATPTRPCRPSDVGHPRTPAALIRIGIDVGGTFTDLVAVDDGSGEARHFKLPSTPSDPAAAIADGVAALLQQCGASGEAIAFLGHGTTVVTNLIIERRGAKTALLTTAGFRDVIEIGRQTRPDLYDYTVERAAAFGAAPSADRDRRAARRRRSTCWCRSTRTPLCARPQC